MNTPMDATDEQIDALVQGLPTISAGAKFPALYVHPSTPVYKLAKGLALMGLAIYRDDAGRMTISESWRIELMRRPQRPLTPAEIEDIERRARD